MKRKILNYKSSIFSIAAASVIFAGCGSNEIDDVYALPEKTTSDYTIRVVDDVIEGATTSANECKNSIELGDGYYKMTACYSRPKAIISIGGYIDLNGTRTEMDFPLVLNTEMVEGDEFILTPLSTLLSTVENYSELKEIAEALGFENVQDMFKDTSSDPEKTKLQQQINGFFIDAKNSGLDLNKFDLLSEQLRENIIKHKDSGNALEVLQNAQQQFKDDFNDPEKRASLIKNYGIVFSGFVTQTNYTEEDPGSFLKNISEKYTSQDDTLVFSGFVYDDIIGAGSNKYDTNATIKLIDLTDSNDSVFEISANDFGGWKIKDVNISEIINDNLYSFEASIFSTDKNASVVLKSLLKGSELLDKFQSKLNANDIPDLTISNVTTAKYACYEKRKETITDVIDFKKSFEENEKDKLLDLSGFVKSMVDGETAFIGTTYEQLFANMEDDCSLKTETKNNTADLTLMKEQTQSDTTLSKQFSSTEKVDVTLNEEMFANITIDYKENSKKFKSTLMTFDNGTFILNSKDDDETSKYEVGTWKIENNELHIKANSSTEATKFSFSGTLSTESKVTVSFKGGGFKLSDGLKGRILNNNVLLTVSSINKTDMTQHQPPLVKFEADKLSSGKTFYEVYKDTNDEYQDRFIRTEANNQVFINEDTADGKTGATTGSWSVDEEGVLTIGTDKYKIKTATITKIITTKNDTEEVELFYSNINAAAAKEIKEYDSSSEYVRSLPLTELIATKNNEDHNKLEIVSGNIVFETKAMDNDENNYAYSYTKANKSFDSTKAVGAKINLSQTFNIGNSYNQTSGYNIQYNLPACNDNNPSGELLVSSFIQADRVAYKLMLKKSDGTIVDLFDKPVTLVNESTIGKTYDIMAIMYENKLAIRSSDGVNSYYQYTDLEKLWESKTDLTYYKFPTQLNDVTLFNHLNKVRHPDGTSIFKEMKNTPVNMKVSKFDYIVGKEDDNYIGGESTVCNSGETTEPEEPTSDADYVMFDREWYKIDKDERYTHTGNSVISSDGHLTLTTLKADNNESRTEIKTDFDPKVNKIRALVNLSETSTEFNMAQLRAATNATVTDDFKNEFEKLVSNDLQFSYILTLKGKFIYAYLNIWDETSKEDVSVNIGTLYYNDSSPSVKDKDIEISIQKSDDTIIFKAEAEGLNTRPIYFNPNMFIKDELNIEDAITSASDFKVAKIRTIVNDKKANEANQENNTTQYDAGSKVELIVKEFEGYNVITSGGGDINYSPSSFIKIPSSTQKHFDRIIDSAQYDATTYTNISNLPTNSNLYSLGYENGVEVEKLDISNNEMKFIPVNGTEPAHVLGTFNIDGSGKLVFDDKEIKYAGSFNANQLNSEHAHIFGDNAKAYAIYEKTTKDTLHIYDGNNSTGYTTLESFIDAQKGTHYMYETAPNSGIAFSDNNSAYTQEFGIAGETITSEASFNALTAGDINLVLNKTLYSLEYERDWDEQLQQDVWGSDIESLTLTSTKFTGVDIMDPDGSDDDNWEDNITISGNIASQVDGKFRMKFIETVDASTLNPAGMDIFTNGTAYKMAFFRDQDEYEWRDEDWSYPKDGNQNFTNIQEYMTWTYDNHFDGNDDDYSYIFAQDSNLTIGNGSLVDDINKTKVIGTWDYNSTTGIVTTNITDSDYWWDENDPWMPTLRVNPDSGFVQKGDYGKAGTGDQFYNFDETAKEEWLTFFNESDNAGSLSYVVNGDIMNMEAGTWNKTSIDGYPAIVLNIYPQYNYDNITPVRVLKDGIVQEGELRKAGESSIHYLFDENGKMDWMNYYSPYPQNLQINAMFENITNTATTDDVKTMVGVIRDLTYSMYRDDNGTESGLMITEDTLHTDKVQSVLEQFESDLNTTANKLEAMTESFAANVENDLNTTVVSIESRLEAISMAIDSQIETNATTITADGIEFSVTYDSEGEITNAVALDQELSATDYNISVSELKLDFNETSNKVTAKLSAQAELNGDNNTQFNGTFNLDADISLPENEMDNMIPSDIKVLNITYDGTLNSQGRSLDGNISLNTNENRDISFVIEGKLQGDSNEPTINGKFTSSGNLLDLDKTALRGEEIYHTYVNYDYNHDNSPILYKNNGEYNWIITKNSDNTYTASNGTDVFNVNEYSEDLIRAKNSSIKVAITNGSDINEIAYISGYDTYDYGQDNIKLNIYLHSDMGGRLELLTSDRIMKYVTWDEGTNSDVSSDVNVTVVSIETKDEDLSSGSMAFNGSIVDGNNSLALNLFANILSKDEVEMKATDLSLTNTKATLGVDEVRAKINEKHNEFNLMVNNLHGTVNDTDNNTLNLTVSGNVRETLKEFEDHNCMYGDCVEEVTDSLLMDLNVSYTYGATSVNGIIHTNFRDMAWEEYHGDFVTSGYYLTRGYSKFTGSVSANNFTPFTVTLEHKLSPLENKTEAFTMLINTELENGNQYSVAARVLQEFAPETYPYDRWAESNETIEFVDSNGVVSYDKGEDIDIIFLRNIDTLNSTDPNEFLGAVDLDKKETTYKESDGSTTSEQF